MRRRGDLTWDNITVASKIMLPSYVAMFTVISLNFFAISPVTLSDSPGLHYADSVFDIQGWGLLFAASAILMITALYQRNRDLFRYALILAAISMFLWAMVMLGAALFGDASASAWAWPAFVTVACVASNRSLLRSET